MTLPFDAIEGKYEILGKLREGGMGAVYKVRHRLLDEIRVIKLIQPHLGVGAEVGDRFLREAKMAIQLRHPNIAQLHDFAVDPDGKAFIVMEYIDGLTLEEIRKASGPPPLGLGLEIAQQTLRAVGYLHKKGFLHRDIAPDNLMLTRGFDEGPLVKLIDLGIARVLKGDQRLTSAGLFLGKPRYASPEQFGGGGGGGGEEIDARSDLYSFGVVLYELLTGVCPIAGKEASALMAGHLFRPPIDFAESDPQGNLPADLRAVLLKTLAKRPEERFATAEELASRLAAIQARYPIAPGELEAVLRPSAASAMAATRVLAPPAATGTTQGRLDREFGPEPTPAPQARAWTNPGATVVLAAHTTVLPPAAPVSAVREELPLAFPPPETAPPETAVVEHRPPPSPEGRTSLRWGLPLVAVLLLLLALGIWQPWRARVQTVPAAVTARRSEPASPPPPAATPVPAVVPAATPVTAGERTEPASAVATEAPTPVPAPIPAPISAPAVIPAPAAAPALAPAPVRRTEKPAATEKKRAPKREVLSAAEAFESESPQPLSMPTPDYPAAARGSGAYAAVTVAVLVGVKGEVKEARVKKSTVDGGVPAAAFEQAALEAARKGQFEPGQKRGAPAEMWWEMTFEFGKKPQ